MNKSLCLRPLPYSWHKPHLSVRSKFCRKEKDCSCSGTTCTTRLCSTQDLHGSDGSRLLVRIDAKSSIKISTRSISNHLNVNINIPVLLFARPYRNGDCSAVPHRHFRPSPRELSGFWQCFQLSQELHSSLGVCHSCHWAVHQQIIPSRVSALSTRILTFKAIIESTTIIDSRNACLILERQLVPHQDIGWSLCTCQYRGQSINRVAVD